MYRKKSLSNFILLALEKSVDGYVKLEDFMYNPGFYAYGSGWEHSLKKSAISRALKRLREYGFVELLSDEGIVMRLTDHGKAQALVAKLLIDDEKWDGKWRIVVFDIPEKRRVARDVLRVKLKRWGFVPWQKSVWVSKKKCTQALREYIKYVGIKDWVMVIESDNVDY